MYDSGQLRTYYDKTAHERETNTVQVWKQVERGRFLEELRGRRAETLLELGPGAGKDSLFFKEQGLQVTAADLSPEMVRLCRAKGIDAQVMDFRSLTFPDANFDAVYALNSLLHTPKKVLPDVLEGIRRVMKPGGLFYLGVYGGVDFEGIREEDRHEPKRFFSFWEDRGLLELTTSYFDLVYFRCVEVGHTEGAHFQSFMLEKRKRHRR